MTKPAPKYRAPALDKGLDILELLASAHQPLSIVEISEGVGRSRGEIFRMLQVLEERDYLARAEGDGGYCITPRLFRLAMEQPPVKSAIEAALPVMHRLAETTEQACHLVVRIGHRRPMSQATSGHVLLAFQDEQVREHWLDLIAAQEPDLDRKKLVRQLAQVRSQSYACARSHVVDAVTDLSAPVLHHGHAVCALTVPFIEQRASAQTRQRTVEALCKATAEISDILHYGMTAQKR